MGCGLVGLKRATIWALGGALEEDVSVNVVCAWVVGRGADGVGTLSWGVGVGVSDQLNVERQMRNGEDEEAWVTAVMQRLLLL